MREPPSPRDQKTKALEEVQGGGGEGPRPALCGRSPPLSVSITAGLGLPCIWGPTALWGLTALVMVMGGLSQGTPSSASPYQLPERNEVHSLGVGQVASPELDLR